ncbi:MAG: DNA methylase [Planctomycetes bacterium]|nr:DNA methylase [Planctomycetota bacterium]
MGHQDRVYEQSRGAGARSLHKPPLDLFTTTLWEYPSQHYDAYMKDGRVVRSSGMQGDKNYVGATPSWLIWQLLMRYTRKKDLVVDPMCGSGTSLDVARDLGRRGIGYDIAPTRDDIFRADARSLPLEDRTADFVFVDPPYSTHVEYSDSPDCIGKLDAGGDDGGEAYYTAMDRVIAEIDRVLKPRRYMALYVSDSWKKRGTSAGMGRESAVQRSGGKRGREEHEQRSAVLGGSFMPIGFELFSIMRQRFTPVDIITIVRHNAKLKRGNWHKAAQEGNFFLRGFGYVFVMKKR